MVFTGVGAATVIPLVNVVEPEVTKRRVLGLLRVVFYFVPLSVALAAKKKASAPKHTPGEGMLRRSWRHLWRNLFPH